VYLDYYCLSQAPFHITPDPKFFFLSSSHQAALGTIAYSIASRQSLVAIFGEAGVGKTTLLRTYLAHMNPQELRTIFVFNPYLAFYDLLKLIFRHLGLTLTTDDPLVLVHQLRQALNEEARQGRRVVLIIDEAQAMPVETLEQLRLLSTLEDTTDPPLQIMLVGQPELQQKLQQDTLQYLEQRIGVRLTILPLTRQESLAYIQHRLAKVTQDDNPIFTEAALRRIVRHAKGVPRVLNILCTNALIAGVAAQQKPITAARVKSVLTESRETRRIPMWQRSLTSSAALTLLASLLWLAPWQGRHDAPSIVSQPTPTQEGDRTAGTVEQTVAPAMPGQESEVGTVPGEHEPPNVTHMTEQSKAPGATSAQQRHTPTTSQESARILYVQTMQELATRLKTTRSIPREHLNTQAMDNLLTKLEPTDKIALPPTSRSKEARKRGTRSLPKAAEGPRKPSSVSAAPAPARPMVRPQPSASREPQRLASAPQQSDPFSPSRAPWFSSFDARRPVHGLEP
jgi:general secretion pathway protein A